MQPWNIEITFPNLATTDFEITSENSETYNCVAWAAGDDTRRWSYPPEYYWPDEVPRSSETEALIKVFESLGYAICDSEGWEAGYEKIALYAWEGQWQHAARQLENGHWTSKLGRFVDIAHPSPDDLTGELYGEVHCIMRRPLR